MFEITESDVDRFTRLHDTAMRGAKLALECFEALKEIRDDELWKVEGYESFDAYLRESFSYTRNYANRLIAAVECRKRVEMKVGGSKGLLSNEGQIRELQTVPDDKLEDVIEAAKEEAEGKPLSGRVLRRAKKRVLGGEAKQEKKPALEVQVDDDSVAEVRVKRIANECLDRLELQLSHLMLRKRWQGNIDKLREEISRA